MILKNKFSSIYLKKIRFKKSGYTSFFCGLCLLPFSTYVVAQDTQKHHSLNENNVFHTHIEKLDSTQTLKTEQVENIRIEQMRIMHVDLDYLYDTNKVQQERNISTLIQRIQKLQPNTIFLQAFADPDANGSANLVYFTNRHIPVLEDLFQPVVKQIKNQTSVQHVYAWLPLLAWELPNSEQLQYVEHSLGKNEGYIRLSPFSKKNQRIIEEIFTDFIQNNSVDGVLYHDDITLSDYEDSSETALIMYKKWGFNGTDLLKNPSHPKQMAFAQAKTTYLDQFANRISRLMHKTKPKLLIARNMYAQVSLNAESEKWFSQSMKSTYRHYDYNAIMAMPYMEKATNHRQFYLDLIQQAKKYDPNLSRTIFELQTTNWLTQTPIPTEELANTIKLLKQYGVKHIGYYPDDFIQEHPDISKLKHAFAQNHL